MQPAPVFLSGESHGQRSLVGYSPEGQKESDTFESSRHALIGTRLVPARLLWRAENTDGAIRQKTHMAVLYWCMFLVGTPALTSTSQSFLFLGTMTDVYRLALSLILYKEVKRT